MKPLFRSLLGTCLTLGIVTPWPSLTQAQTQAFDGRIVIIDASGSMKRNDYPQNEGSRWNEAMALAKEYFEQLEDRNDTVPTEVMVFGAQTNFVETLEAEKRKPASQHRFTNSKNYPVDGALCRDIGFVTSAFTPPSSDTWKSLKQFISALPGGKPQGGMTPQGPAFNLAFQRLIDQYGPGVNAQIVAFSDFEDINCAPRDQTVCDQILPSLNILANNGGKAEMRILEIPSSDLVLDLLECAPTKTDSHDPGGTTPAKTIEDFIGNLSVRASVKSTTPGLLNPAAIDLIGMSFQAFKANSPNLVSGGPAQNALPLAPGRYDFVLSKGASEWRVAQEVKNDQEIVFTVEAGQVQLTAIQNGTLLPQLASLDVRDVTGALVTPGGSASLPASLVLMAGQYQISGQFGGQTQTLPVDVNFGKMTAVALSFDQIATAARPVLINLDIRTPTLDIVAFEPQVQLTGNSAAAVPLTNTRNSLSLVPGAYNVLVGGVRQHDLRFNVPNGTTPMDVRVVITPGWFEATAPVPGGSFELQDATGLAIATLTGDRVRHSLADGVYRLVHISPDGQQRESPLRLTTGDFSEVRF